MYSSFKMTHTLALGRISFGGALQDAQLPSYYKHLREGASKAPPPDIASGEADGSEPPQFGPARAAAGYAQMYGPRNDPHGERHHGQEPPDSSPYPENRPGLGARSGLGALGAAAPGEYRNALPPVCSELYHLSQETGPLLSISISLCSRTFGLPVVRPYFMRRDTT